MIKYHVEGNMSRIRPREISSDGNISGKDELTEQQHLTLVKSDGLLGKKVMSYLDKPRGTT